MVDIQCFQQLIMVVMILVPPSSGLWLPDGVEPTMRSPHEDFREPNRGTLVQNKARNYDQNYVSPWIVAQKYGGIPGNPGKLTGFLGQGTMPALDNSEPSASTADAEPLGVQPTSASKFTHPMAKWIDNTNEEPKQGPSSDADSSRDGSGWYHSIDDEGSDDIVDDLSDDAIWEREREEERRGELAWESTQSRADMRGGLGSDDANSQAAMESSTQRSAPEERHSELSNLHAETFRQKETENAPRNKWNPDGSGNFGTDDFDRNLGVEGDGYFDNDLGFEESDINADVYDSSPSTLTTTDFTHAYVIPEDRTTSSSTTGKHVAEVTRNHLAFPGVVLKEEVHTSQESSPPESTGTTTSTLSTTVREDSDPPEPSTTATLAPCLQKCEHLLDKLILRVEPERLLAEVGINVTATCQAMSSTTSQDLTSVEVGWQFRRNGNEEACWLTTAGEELEEEKRCEDVDRVHETQSVNQTSISSWLNISTPSSDYTGLYICVAYIRCCEATAQAQTIRRDVSTRLRVYRRPRYTEHLVITSAVCVCLVAGIAAAAFVKRRRRRKKADAGMVANCHYQPVRMLRLPDVADASHVSNVTGNHDVENDNDVDDFDDDDDFDNGPAGFPPNRTGKIHTNRLSELLPLPTPPPTPPVTSPISAEASEEEFPRPPSSVIHRFSTENDDGFE